MNRCFLTECVNFCKYHHFFEALPPCGVTRYYNLFNIVSAFNPVKLPKQRDPTSFMNWQHVHVKYAELVTLMSSGQPSSCRFPLTRRWISSSVSSLVGRGPRTSAAASWPCSSVEPKLLGRVLLRGRVCGPSSLSAQCLASGGGEHMKKS